MSKLQKINSGLVYEEAFGTELNLPWSLSPNNTSKINFEEDAITLLPADVRTDLLFPIPTDAFHMQADVEFAAASASDRGGCTVQSVTDNSIDCELSGGDTESYEYMKLDISKECVVALKGSSDGISWADFGNGYLGHGNQVGFYLDAGTTVPLKIKGFVLCQSPNVSINGLPAFDKVVVLDGTQDISSKLNIRLEENAVYLDCSEIILPIKEMKLQLYKEEVLVSECQAEEPVYGGDLLTYSEEIEVEITGYTPNGNKYDLGLLTEPVNYYSLKIKNIGTAAIENRTLSIFGYSVYDGGDKNVYLAKGMLGDETLNFEKEIPGVSIQPEETLEFVIKIEKSKDLISFEFKHKFRILLS